MKNVQHYRDMHNNTLDFGTGTGHVTQILILLYHLNADKILDYGCGKGVLATSVENYFNIDVDRFDPAVKEFLRPPSKKYDALLNTDVLEHIPEEELDCFINKLFDLSQCSILIPHLELSGVFLTDGSNVHCTIKTPEEWKEVFERKWQYVYELPHPNKQHALFLCSKDSLNIDKLTAVLEREI